MPAQTSHSLVRIVIGAVAVLTLLAYFSPTPPVSIAAKLSKMTGAADTSQDPIPGLVVTLAQVPSASPPAFRATITNKNPFAVSFLDYDSPVDELVVQLGLVELTPAAPADAKPVALDSIKVNRLWPPKVDFVQEIPAGGSVSGEVAVRPKSVPYEKLGDRFFVQMKGEWRAVMAMPKSEVTKEFLEHIPARPNTYQEVFVYANVRTWLRHAAQSQT
ncbi:hypothetical protein LMH87_011292 [Akanthomyces muscarius]|uniref:Uncharacterized protein n=1 Tax=Akanthomyces muscarius TaxID=2231603 RepID=A0A9W8UKU2_AKAMU|nr:hypothetical protein LMH87_011292 [Akanthomyces muscarius]KAJ4150546.1 hypothetical protein LMH87_011292 [Akanthomyces muscarius]